MKRRSLLLMTAAVVLLSPLRLRAAEDVSGIAHDAYVYLYPMVQNYLSIYQWALDPTGSQYKGPPGQVNNVARVYTPEDTGVITPNSDTPYSYLIMDLRAEPVVVTLPAVEDDRYYSLQIVDLYSHNVDYLGTRRDGNGGGDFLIAGPGWAGELPKGVKRVVMMPTSIAFSQFRTELKSPDDIERVKEIQAGYTARPLSAYAGTPAPAAPPAIDWPPISAETMQPRFWELANFLLRFAPPLPWEQDLRASFARIGVAPAPVWPATPLPEAEQAEVIAAGDAALKEIAAGLMTLTSSFGLFGTPERMRGKYMARAAAAMGGLYGNDEEEALYPTYLVDANGQPFDTAHHKYVMRLAPEAFPPVDAFWSITMYDGITRFLVDNPLKRYLINSTMLESLKRDPDGGITLYLQHESPGPDLEPNWLPAPDGPMAVVMRLYLPKPEALDGRWTPPPIDVQP